MRTGEVGVEEGEDGVRFVGGSGLAAMALVLDSAIFVFISSSTTLVSCCMLRRADVRF
jgi:hypothetical protein